ncbi:MAG: hypothetical protein WC144_06785 [Sulfurimonas sp.]
MINNKLNILFKIFNKCSKKNWDGYDALPLSVTAYNEAIKVIKLLPPDLLKKVEISPLNDGGIAFEWYHKKHYIFSMAVTGQNEITYSGLYGIGNESYGKENFSGYQFPVKLIELIKSVYYGIIQK